MRIAEGNAFGFGLHTEATIGLLPGFLSVPWLSSRLSGEFRYYDAEGDVTQTWYGNAGGISAGTVLADLPYTFESLRFGVSLGIAINL
jgi:hypothetical protein